MNQPFAVLDCALIAIATGQKAHDLRELRDRLISMSDPGIMYYHFWDALLRPRFVDPEYQNDFAAWVWHDLHDRRLAERLSILNPADYRLMDDLRHKMIEVIEERMDEEDFMFYPDADHPFFFCRSQIVIFDTHFRIDDPRKLSEIIAQMSLGSIFYHFIDSRRRTHSGINDFSVWLRGFEGVYEVLADEIDAIDPYFDSLPVLRNELVTVVEKYFKKGNH